MWRNPLAGRFGLTLSTIALAAAIVMMAQWRPLVVATLDPAQIVPERGHLFQVRVSRLAPDGYQIGGDDVPRRFRSDVTVTRDGTPLGPGHANHDDIRQTGGGAFGVWSGVLFFSTPDNTDPRTDGAVYSIAARAQPLPQTAAFVLLIAVGFAALSLLSPTARGLVRLAGLRSRSMPARVLLALVAAGAVGLHMTDNWDEYVNSPDSFGYFSNAFVEASYRQPGVYLWHRIFSDPEAIKTMLPQTPTNVPLTAGPRDPILPGIRAQRVLLAVGFAVITYAMGYLIGPIAALLISLCLVSVESMSAAAAEVAIATALIGLIAIWRGSRLRFEKEEPVATPAGPAKPDALARLPGRVISLLGLGLTVYSFFPAIFANSFFSQEDIWLGSDALATGWTLLFVAALMWFLHARAATALLLCAVLAAFAFLTRPGSIFVVVLFAGLCPLALSVNWRRFLVPVIASTGIAVMLINSVALYGLLSGRRDAGVLNLQTAVVIGFALSIAQPEDEKIFADDV